MTSVTVVSSIYGGYDTPAAPPAQDIDCDWVLVTDQPCDCPPWRVIVEPRPAFHPRLAAKVAKCRPDLYAPEARVLLWVDGNLHIEDPGFVRWATEAVRHGALLAAHLSDKRLTDELDQASRMPKYTGQPLAAQVEHYLDSGHPDHGGVWWTGLMAWWKSSPAMVGDASLREQVRWSYEDQLSLPPTLWRTGMRPDPLTIDWDHKRFTLTGHRDDK